MKPNAVTLLNPTDAYPVTPSDTDGFDESIIYVGTAGNVAVRTSGGQTVTFANVPAGSTLPVMVTRVFSTGTTAGNIVRCS